MASKLKYSTLAAALVASLYLETSPCLAVAAEDDTRVEAEMNPLQVAQTLSRWAQVWSAQMADEYLSFYSKDFQPAGGATHKQWQNQRRERLQEPVLFKVTVDELTLQQDGNELVRAEFIQTYRTDGYLDRVLKVLILANNDGRLEIVSERTLRVLAWNEPHTMKFTSTTDAPVTSYAPEAPVALDMAAEGNTRVEAEINPQLVDRWISRWAQAWSDQITDEYLSFYSKDFRPAGGATLKQWQKQRRKRLQEPSVFKVTVDELTLQQAGDGLLRAEFIQTNRVEGYQDRVLKVLIIANNGGRLEIVSERTLRVLAWKEPHTVKFTNTRDAPVTAMRRRPGTVPETEEIIPIDPAAVLPPQATLPRESLPVPDRWRLVEALGVNERWFDPYNQNTMKADRPVYKDWFVNLSLISDSLYEPRRLPAPVGPQATRAAGTLDIFGGRNQSLFNQNIIMGLVVYKGNTVFRPPDYEFRFTPVLNYNRSEVDQLRILHINPEDGRTRYDNHLGIQELFLDVHLRNVSDRYDFDSIRAGIQPFNADFRGFLYQEESLGIRLFGNRDNNLYQYNLAWFHRIEKDTNSGLNDLARDLRDDDVFVANIYRQDLPVLGFTSQLTVLHNRNRENKDPYYDNNGFLVRPASVGTERPRKYDVTYFGYNGDGHFGRLNLTASAYYAHGRETPGIFIDESSDIRAFFSAAEISMDFDWLRLRGSALYASGDDDPFDDQSNGFDSVFENPVFAGADTSFWIRQAVPNIGGGGVALSGRNGILNSLRPSKEQGQANFTNPGIVLLGLGMDIDITPETRLSGNLNHLAFSETAVIEVLRQQTDIDSEIGWDVSMSLIHRPWFSQNIIIRLSGAMLIPGTGFKQLFGSERSYSVLGNVILAY